MGSNPTASLQRTKASAFRDALLYVLRVQLPHVANLLEVCLSRLRAAGAVGMVEDLRKYRWHLTWNCAESNSTGPDSPPASVSYEAYSRVVAYAGGN